MLNDDHRCSIHKYRNALGFAACAAYDCYGAGQWTTQRFVDNKQETPITEVLDAFRTACAVHELLAIVRLALIALVGTQSDSERQALEEYERSVQSYRELTPHAEVRRRVALEKRSLVTMLRTASHRPIV